jgi:hypothetical protein
MRENFTPNLGPFEYSIGKYAKLIRAVVPLEIPQEELYLLLSFDVGSDAVRIIEKKIIKFLKDDQQPTMDTLPVDDELGLSD